jgi:L,D-transpeptidase YcbB
MIKRRIDLLLASVAVTAILVVSPSINSAFASNSPAETAPSASEATAKSSAPAAETPAPDAAPAPEAAPAPAATIPAATETTGVVTPEAAAVAQIDSEVAGKLREMTEGKFDKLLGGRKERAEIEKFYSERNFAPLWITDGAASERAKAAVNYLVRIDEHGLEPSEYASPAIRAGMDAEALAEAELKTTQAVLDFARHAEAGRVHYSRIGGDIAYDLVRSEPADVLKRIATAGDTVKALDSFHPTQKAYWDLKTQLAKARRTDSSGPKRIPGGLTLKYSKDKKGKEALMYDPRVPALRERLGVEGDPDNKTYDAALADAVKKFQRENKIRPTGQLNPATLAAINGPTRDKDADIIIANMERLRWMPRDLGKTHVMVNIPDYTLKIVHNGATYWKTRIVVGKPSQATPITTSDMKFITVNPTWNVPPSIIQNEYLPALAQDPTVLDRMGLKIQQAADGTVRIWQPPGDSNALGRIRFNFPNKFLVYQHDTPDKNLFKHEKRAYSHGCMRVQDPLMYGEKLLSLALPNEGYTQERLRKMYGGSEVNINFPVHIPVHMTYQSAYVDDAGKLVIRDDIYGRDQRLLAVLKGPDRRVAESPVQRARTNYAAPVRVTPGTYGGAQPSGFSFFDRLFGGSTAAPATPQQQRQRAARRHQVY